MHELVLARQLADFIRRDDVLHLAGVDAAAQHPYGHIGATLADAVLQAGLNYRLVVRPRIDRLRAEWPDSSRMSGFLADQRSAGVGHMLWWDHDEKPRRLADLTLLLSVAGVEDEPDLARWLGAAGNLAALRAVRGIGPKTVDYLCGLVGLPAVAVDRHVVRFVVAAGVRCDGFDDYRQVVSYAADLLGVGRWSLDNAIWTHMSGAAVGDTAACASPRCRRRGWTKADPDLFATVNAGEV